MMQAAEHWDRGDVASTRPRNATCGDRDPLTDPLMRPGDVEVAESVLLQHAQQVALAQDDHVVEALAPDAPKESLAGRVHQGRLHGGLEQANSGALGDPVEDGGVLVVAIPNQEFGAL